MITDQTMSPASKIVTVILKSCKEDHNYIHTGGRGLAKALNDFKTVQARTKKRFLK